jgi:hypothetical protein
VSWNGQWQVQFQIIILVFRITHKDLESGIIDAFGNGESGAYEVQNDNNLTMSPKPNACAVDKDVMIESYEREKVSMAMLQSPEATLDYNMASNFEKPGMFHILT